MAWASLQEAVEAVRAAGVGKPEETILRAVSNAGLVRPGSQPLPDRTPDAPRVRVITPRTIVGMDWLQAPVLDFERSEILCRSYMMGTQGEFSHPRDCHPARIELWREDIDRLWPTTSVPSVRKGAGGRKPVVDWQMVRTEALRLLEDEGAFDPAVAEWNSQERLVERLQYFCQKSFGHEPGRTSITDRVPQWLAEWRPETKPV